MPYKFPIKKYIMSTKLYDDLFVKYGMPKWLEAIIAHIFIKCNPSIRATCELNNYALAYLIEKSVPNFFESPVGFNSPAYLCNDYNKVGTKYTGDELNTLLHTFPFSKDYLLNLITDAIEYDRVDLVVVVEKFIEERCLFDENVSDRFEL